MRLFVVLFIISFHISVMASAQKVTIRRSQVSLAEVIRELKNQSGYHFLFDAQAIRSVPKVSIAVREASLREALDQCLEGLPLTYTIEDNNVIISKKEVTTQQRIVTGRISDEEGNILQGVTVRVKQTGQQVISGADGAYRIAVRGENNVLVFSMVGFMSQEHGIANRSALNVTLRRETSNLDEVVVIGYGTANRRDLSGSIASVSVKNSGEGAYSNFQQVLAGRAAGVVVSETSGQPGSGLSIEVRGINSLNFSTQPLYVVDGIPLDIPPDPLSSLATPGTDNVSSPLSAINPADIASIEVLKDASATAIYGSRGANGVVLITTKTGESGKPKVGVNFSNGASGMLKNIQMLTSEEYAILANEANKYRIAVQGYGIGGGEVPFTDEEIQNLPYYNHQKAITRNAQTRDLNVSVSGGNDGQRYFLSGQYYDQQGIIIGTEMKRYNFKINYDNNLSKKLQLTTSLNLSSTRAKGNIDNVTRGGYLFNALNWAPTSPLINPDGSYNPLRSFQYGDTKVEDPERGTIYYNPRFDFESVIGVVSYDYNNPLAFLEGIINHNTSNQVIGKLGLDYKFTPDLTLSGLLGITMFNTLLENYIPTTVPRTWALRGAASVGNMQSAKLLYQSTLNYRKKIHKHHINAVAGMTLEDFESRRQTAASQSFTTDATGPYAVQAGAVVQLPETDVNNFALISGLLRANYHFNYRYYLTLSARYDGSSKFAPGNQFGFFPSVGASWRIQNERWFKIKAVNEFKLRLSHGIIGNQAIGAYNTLSTLSYVGAVFGSTVNTAYAPSRIPNPDLKWEQTVQTNAGLDLNMLKDRISLTVDAYQRNTANLLYNVILPGSSGFTNMFRNVASLSNKGLEIAVSTVNVSSDKFKWTTGFNISFNRNVVNKLSGLDGEFLPVQVLLGTAYLSRVEAGKPLGQFYGYKSIGVWNDETILTKPETFQVGVSEGERRYEDVNGDGLLTDADRVYIGSALPRYTGGFNTAFSYQQFELSAFFSFSKGNQVFNRMDWNLRNMSGFDNTLKDAFDKRYIMITADTDPAQVDAIRENNKTTKTMSAGHRLDAREVTDYYVEDGSFLRCRDITLNYRLPERFARYLTLSNCMLYLNLQNMFTITKYSGFNPEVNTGSGVARGLDSGSYPLAKSIRVGINVGL